ncbi:flagellar hook-length control protein FliK [Geobacter grbiciae]|uniref:flagellar hook-length control protein FliK n=1 Tax=Geobacter grbiciae TaxID=155042 RepID=UPI001C022641|nr:flagellar hook-length control protein FliK [Geobacter grbiciae]MBT1074800.1 flagellar hook-length control protein FliK [Geobacter grbiciae]
MIITQDIARIAQALLKDTTGSLVEATWQSLTPLNLTPGQMVHGEVMANFANSRYLVRIANELLHMELPLNLQPGQAVELTYVTDEPRLLFALSKSGNSATPVQISDTGRWLNTLAQGTGGTQVASPLPRPSLVISGPPRDPALLAEGLKNVLSRSGVFYESHLAQWVQGEYPLTDLLREPQGQLSPLAGRLPAEGNGATTTLQGVRVSPGETPPAPAPPAVTPGLPLEEGVTPPPPRTIAEGSPSAPGNAAPDAAPRQGETPPSPDTPKAGQTTSAAPRDPLPQTAISPQNQPPAPGRPGAPAPLPAEPQGGMATTSPDPETVDAPPAAPQNAAAPTGAPLPKSVGEVPGQQPATTVLQGGQPPQPRDAVVPNPTEFGHPAPASSPDARPQTEGHPQSLLRDGAAATSPGRASSPPPLPATLEGGARAAITGETAPTSREALGRLAEPPPPAGIESQTIPIIKEQLATLTTGVFTWFGQAWPGQDMEWKVEEREAEGGKGERSWLTEVGVELPSLGAVRATLRAGKEGIGVTLVAEEGRTAEILAAGQNGLEERFGAAGLRLGGFTVRDGSQ